MKTILCFTLLSLVAIVLSADSTLGKPKEDSTASLLNSLTSFEKELENQNKVFQAIAAKKKATLSKLKKPTADELKKAALNLLNEIRTETASSKQCKGFTKKSLKFNKKLVSDIKALKKLLLSCPGKHATAEQLKKRIKREIERLRKILKKGCPGAIKGALKVRADIERDIQRLKRHLNPHKYFTPNRTKLVAQTKEQIAKMKKLSKNYRKLVLKKKDFHLRLFKQSKHDLVKMSPLKLVPKKLKGKAKQIRSDLKQTVKNLTKIMAVSPKPLRGYIKRAVKRENVLFKDSFDRAISRH